MVDVVTNDGTIDYTQIEINFQERVTMRAQQTMSLTEPFITFVGGKGRETKTAFWGGQPNLDEKSQRFQTYPQKITPRDAYWFGTRHYWDKEPIDGDDQLFDAVDAGSGLAQVWGATAARETDRLYIQQAIGTAYRGRFGQTTPQALPASQIIPHGNVGLTAAKVIQAVAMIRRAAPETSDPIVCFVTSFQINNDLMSDNKVISHDWNEQRPLRDLTLPFYFGSYFKIIEDFANFSPDVTTNVAQFDPIIPLLLNGVSAGVHIRYCVMWVKSAMRGKNDRPIQTKLHDESKDHGPDAKSLTIDMMKGATRVNPLGVVVIECAETAARVVV